jgi:flagellum-specific ATP synthase
MNALAGQISELDGVVICGRVVGVRGLMVEVAGPLHACRSARVSLSRRRASLFLARSWGFLVATQCSFPFAPLEGVRRGCRAVVTTFAGAVRPSAGWLGRVVNALGEPIDGEGALLLGPSPAARSFSCPR